MIVQNFTLANILNSNGVPLDLATVRNTPAFGMNIIVIDSWFDYLLRDETGAPITDENGDDISLEGLLYA